MVPTAAFVFAAFIVEPTVAKSPAAAANVCGVVLTCDIGQLHPCYVFRQILTRSGRTSYDSGQSTAACRFLDKQTQYPSRIRRFSVSNSSGVNAPESRSAASVLSRSRRTPSSPGSWAAPTGARGAAVGATGGTGTDR